MNSQNISCEKNINYINMDIEFLDCEGQIGFKCNHEGNREKINVLDFQYNFLQKNSKHNIFEVLRETMKIKPFYDLDKGFETKEEFDNTHEDLLRKFQTFLYSMYPNCNLAISEANGWKTKKNSKIYFMSFHVVVNNYETSMSELREYNERFNIYNKFDFVDKAVYRTNGLMKCLYGSKSGEKRYKKIFVNNDPLKHLITSNKETNTGFEPLPSPAVSPVSKPIQELVL